MDAEGIEVEFGDGARDRDGTGRVEGREFGDFVALLGGGGGWVAVVKGEVGFVVLVGGPGGGM